MGNSIAEVLLSRGYGIRPHRVMPLGVDLERFFPAPEVGRSVRASLGWSEPGPPVIGFLGRFVPEKGLAMLMATLDALKTPWRPPARRHRPDGIEAPPLGGRLQGPGRGGHDGQARRRAVLPQRDGPARRRARRHAPGASNSAGC